MRPTWGVLISGRGSNLAAILELRDEIDLRVVLSSRADADGLLKARRAAIACGVIETVAGTRKVDWQKLTTELRSRGVSHIFLAGFMKVLPASFVSEWSARILNLHPSLLPLYPGLDSIERSYSDGANIGATVHEVVVEVDAGKIETQRQTLAGAKSQRLGLELCEFLVHVDEQRIVKESIRKWSRHPGL